MFKKFSLRSFQSQGYGLTPVEFKDVAPFDVKRAYYLKNFAVGATTGEHCHKIEEEIFIVAEGAVTIIIDKGSGKEEIVLNENDAVFVPAYVWHGFKDPRKNCVILALSSTNYSPDRSDYVDSYEEYLQIRDRHL